MLFGIIICLDPVDVCQVEAQIYPTDGIIAALMVSRDTPLHTGSEFPTQDSILDNDDMIKSIRFLWESLQLFIIAP